jgi:two-component system cell cycle sensor histidine kinase/response regulator CckA
LEATNVDVSEIAQRMKQLLGVSISKKISLRFELAGALPPVRADTSQLRQVLLNLVLNASEASGNEPGVISVRTGIEHCSSDSFESTYFQENLQEGAYVFIEVTDSGSGMDAETKARLFDPFYTTKFLGRGLGLAAVLGIVRAHSGAIRVYSELGRGSTLKVLLPALDLGAVPTVSPTSRRRMGGGLVLLADDEPSVRSVGQRMLERLGYRVLIAEDGQQAVALLERHGASVVLVLLDMAMPHLDGVEAFREMRRLRPDIRVVLTSGYSESEATSRFAGKGLAGFLQKPFRLDALRTVMQAAVAETSGESAR